MKKIPLTQGLFTLVNNADYEWLNQWKWYANRKRSSFYVRRKISRNSSICMHRQILGLKYGDGKQTDHIDGNGLNNQRANLRECTNQQNHFNRKSVKGSTSQFKGVYTQRKTKNWAAKIKLNGHNIHLGSFKSEVNAAKAYDVAAIKHFGEFARLNFPRKE